MKKTLLFRALLSALACLLALTALAEPAVQTARPPFGTVYREHRSRVREDYPHLTDEEFANFRGVATTGMGRNVLYRSSSPIDPRNNRDRLADAAARKAGIRTVLNLADSRKEMALYEGFENSYYSGLDIIPLNLNQNRMNLRDRDKVARGFRYIIDHDGPYLVHCTLGRDRTGFVCAVLECLMGAPAGEVLEDYMLTYYNYYGIEPGLAVYDDKAEKFCADLSTAFGIDRFTDRSVDLARCASDYILSLGLTEEEVAALKARLGADLSKQN